MTRKRKDFVEKSLCPLTSDESLRAAADRKSDAIKDGFPPGIGRPALRALAAASYTHLDQLTQAREAELPALHGMGPKAMGIIRDALTSRKKRFRT
jgi:hypothetical protein